MSNVKVGDRHESKTAFDNAYYKIFDDSLNLTELKFGASAEQKEQYSTLLKVRCEKIHSIVDDIGTHIRIANSIYPHFELELAERRLHQEKAIGLCFDLLTKYHNTMKFLKVKDDKYVEEMKHIAHEIFCLRKWKDSDKKRFTNLG